MDDTTDLTTHHIQGHARAAQERHMKSFFKVPLISQITDTLWTGGCRQDVKLPTTFRYVISLYQWEQYVLPPGCSRIEVEMYDAAEMPDEPLVYAVAEMAAGLAAEGPTLIHCQAGLNRSGLIGALALLTLNPTLSAKDAIALLREKRCDLVLCNETFENWLLKLDD